MAIKGDFRRGAHGSLKNRLIRRCLHGFGSHARWSAHCTVLELVRQRVNIRSVMSARPSQSFEWQVPDSPLTQFPAASFLQDSPSPSPKPGSFTASESTPASHSVLRWRKSTVTPRPQPKISSKSRSSSRTGGPDYISLALGSGIPSLCASLDSATTPLSAANALPYAQGHPPCLPSDQSSSLRKSRKRKHDENEPPFPPPLFPQSPLVLPWIHPRLPSSASPHSAPPLSPSSTLNFKQTAIPHSAGADAASDALPRPAKRRYIREADKLNMILDFIHVPEPVGVTARRSCPSRAWQMPSNW